MNGTVVDVGALIKGHRDEWDASTSASPFIASVRSGTLDAGAVERWLAQDRHFIDGLYDAQLRIAALASGEARRVLVEGVVALQEELDWLAVQSVERGIHLDVEPVDACLAFVEYLQTLSFAPLAVALTAIWAVERSYLDAWSAARPGAQRYREFVEHWSNDDFQTYVARLQEAADAALHAASDSDREEAGRAFGRVMQFERRFWQMAERGE